MEQLKKQGLGFSDDKDSYRYVDKDSWLFDYAKKKELLNQVFDKVIYFSYNPNDMVKLFMTSIGYSAEDTKSIRLNVTQ